MEDFSLSKKWLLIIFISSISLVLVSSYTVPAFADHEIRGKSAYFFDCSGKNNSWPGHNIEVRNFVEANNGAYHRCAHNWIDAAIHKDNDNVRVDSHGLPDSSPRSQDKVAHRYVTHDGAGTACGNPCAWFQALRQFDDGWTKQGFGQQPGLPLPEQQHNAKLILRGYSWGGSLVTMMASQERCTPAAFGILGQCDNDIRGLAPVDTSIPSFTDTNFDFVWMIDPVGPAGLRNTLTTSVGIHQTFPCCTVPRIFGENVDVVLTYFQSIGGGDFPIPLDWWHAGGFDEAKQKVRVYEENWAEFNHNFPGGAAGPHDLGTEYCTTGSDGHGCMNTSEPTLKQVLNRGLDYMKAMNKKPEIDTIPTITIDEGQSASVALRATDQMPPAELFSSTTKQDPTCPGDSFWSVILQDCFHLGGASCDAAFTHGFSWTECRGTPLCPGGYFYSGYHTCDNGWFGFVNDLGCATGATYVRLPGTNSAVDGVGTAIEYCSAPIKCREDGLNLILGGFDCRGPKQAQPRVLEEFPELKLRVVEFDNNLEIVSFANGAKTNCQFGLGFTAGCPADNMMIRQGVVEILVKDGDDGTSTVKIQAEDNGFPCDSCTGGNQEASFNAKGDWVQKLVSITVNNVAPTPNIEGPSVSLTRVNEFILSATDPSTIDQETGFTYEIDWGDGTSDSITDFTAGDVLVSHSFDTVGDHIISVTAQDKDGGFSTVTHTLTISDQDGDGISDGLDAQPGDTSGNFEDVPCVTGTYDPNTDTCVGDVIQYCPAGTILNLRTNLCGTTPSSTCPSGSVLNSATNLCEAQLTGCPLGSSFNSVTNLCEVNYTCPSGTSLNSVTSLCEEMPSCLNDNSFNDVTDLCEIPAGSCPAGTTLNVAGTECIASPEPCPSGTVLNTATNFCEVVPTCPTDTSFNSATSLCELQPTGCPVGSSFNSVTNLCELQSTDCPVDFSFNSATNLCETVHLCATGSSFNSATDLCEASSDPCPTGTTLNTVTGLCEADPFCPTGSTANDVTHLCEAPPSCPTDFSLDTITNLCVQSPMTCPSNTSFNAATNLCEAQRTVCPSEMNFNSITNLCEVAIVCPAGSSLILGTGLCVLEPTGCSVGYSFNSATNLCEAQPTGCPAGSSFNSVTSLCEALPSCPAGTTFNSGTELCDASPSFNCPTGTTLNIANTLCIASPELCPTNTSLNTLSNLCEAVPTSCPYDTMFNPATNLCEAQQTDCPTDSSLNSATGLCEALGSCPEFSSFNDVTNLCELQSTVCPTGFNLNPGTSLCEALPSCPAGMSFFTSVNSCVLSPTTCPSDSSFNSVTGLCEAHVSEEESSSGSSSGQLVNSGDQDISILEDSNPGGIFFNADVGGGIAPATIIACEDAGQVQIDSGDSGNITCGSITVTIESGSVDAQFNTNRGPATTTMGPLDSLTFDGDITFTNNSLTPAVITIGGRTFTLAPGETLTLSFPSGSTSYQDPHLGDPKHGGGHNNGFCMNQNCINVNGFFNHFPESIVPQGSTQTFSLLINCPRGVDTCNHATIEGVLPDSDFYAEQWGVTLERLPRSDTWEATINNPYGEIGEVTTTVQELTQTFLAVSYNIEFLIPGSIGTADGIGIPHENNRHLHVTVWDNKRGLSNYIFNEGVYVDDIYAYPQVETSYEKPIEIEPICNDMNANKRYTCAFDKVREWTIKNAEKALLEIEGKTQLDVLNEEFLSKFRELKQAIADNNAEKISELQAQLDELGTKIHNMKK